MSVGPSRRPSRTLAWVEIASGGLYFVVAGLLLYFRFISFARVAGKMRERGTPLPDWMPIGFTLGVVLVVALFVVKGARLLRRGGERVRAGKAGRL